MENIGDWLYVVFIVIAALSSLLSSRKKNKSSEEILTLPGKRPAPPPHETPEHRHPQKKETYRPAQAPPAAPSVEEYIHSMEEHESTQTKKNRQTPAPFLTGETAASPVVPASGHFSGDNPEEPDSAPAVFSFDGDEMRKAVIYSEILRRKF